MELQDLKSGWQNAGGVSKSETDILHMTKITNHPSLKRIRRKLMIETIMLLLFLVVYYDWFDGDKKPFYANAVLIAGLLLYIGNDVIGYIAVVNPISGLNLKLSLAKYVAVIKRLAIFSLVFSFLYSVALIVFFTSVIHFTREKNFLLLGMIIVLFQMVFWSQRIWTKWIKSLQQQVKEFDLDDEIKM